MLLNILAVCKQMLRLNPFDIMAVILILVRDFTDASVESKICVFSNFYNKNAPESKQLNRQDEQNKLSEIKNKLRVAPSKDKKQLEFQSRDSFIGPDYLCLLKQTELNRGRGISVLQDIENLIELLIDYYEKQIQNFIIYQRWLYLRMASEEYRTNDIDNIYIHLTNNAQNKIEINMENENQIQNSFYRRK